MKIALPALWILALYSASAFASNAELSKDLQEIRKLPPLTKGELETTAEYKSRISILYKQYANRTYQLAIPIKEQNAGGGEKIATYDADKSMLNISLPRLTSHLFWDEKNNIRFLKFSYMPIVRGDVMTETYTARNRLGTEVVVQKATTSSLGIAVLGRSNPNLTPQTFAKSISREKVRDILDRGKVIITLKTDLQMLGGKPSLLILDEIDIGPTMQRPTHVVHNKFMLPVRLISVSLHDGNGAELFTMQGKEQNTSAIER